MTNLEEAARADVREQLLATMAWNTYTTEGQPEHPFFSNADLRLGSYGTPRIATRLGQFDKTADGVAWGYPVEWHVSGIRRENAVKRTETIRQRLADANGYFRRKAGEVVNDEDAIMLLAAMYQDIVLDISTLDTGREGLSLAKLAAANFCEIGDKLIYITETGQRFVKSILDA